MDAYDIILAPDPVLKQKSSPVSAVDDALRTQMDRMMETMHGANGIGLAANQVGITNRVFVMDLDPESWVYGPEGSDGVLTIESRYRSGEGQEEEAKSHAIMMVNPEIIWKSEQRSVFDEGCLSFPSHYGIVERPAKVRVQYIDYHGQKQEIEVEGLESHCIQHEIDHLDGILFVDHLSKLKRDIIIRKMEKIKKGQTLL